MTADLYLRLNDCPDAKSIIQKQIDTYNSIKGFPLVPSDYWNEIY